MAKIHFMMAGSGNWRSWLPDDSAHALYERIYPGGARLDQLQRDERERVLEWQAPGFVTDREGMVVPLVPVFTDEDDSALAGWFSGVTEQAVAIVAERIGEYRDLAGDLSEQGRASSDNLLTILLCAHTLDCGTLEQLEQNIFGSPPPRAGSGNYFVWGRSARPGRTCSFGISSFPLWGEFVISLIHASSVERVAPKRPAVAVPVLDSDAMQSVRDLCVPVSRRLAEVFSTNIESLEDQLPQCSFRTCSRVDYLCMLFHIRYGRVARALVDTGLLPAFPARADSSWGVWIRPST